MCNRLNSYIENNNILSSTQFGFRKGVSTEDAILEFLDDAYNTINKALFAFGTVFNQVVNRINPFYYSYFSRGATL